MLWQAVDDLVQLLGRRGLVETSQVHQLVDDARVLRGLEGPMEAGAALLGAGIFRGDLSSLRRLLSEVFGETELEPLVNQAVDALREGVRAGASRARSSSHWLDTRAGELTTWIILSGAVDLQRRKGSTADLDRTAVWVRSMLDGVLAATRSGPPPEVRLGAEVIGGTIAQYERGPGDLAVAALRRASGREGLREWAVSWLAERLRVSASGIDPHRSFADHGVDSLAAVEFAKALGDRVGVVLDETLLWNFPTIDSLLSYLEAPAAKPALAPASTRGVAAIEDRDEPGEGTELEQELARLERELKKH
jgi:acyl carrier protein